MSPAPPSIEWYLARDGKQHGPVSDAEMQKLVELGHLKPTDLVWRSGLDEWTPAAAVFTPRASPSPALQAAPQPSPHQPAAQVVTVAQPQPQPQSHSQPAPRQQSVRPAAAERQPTAQPDRSGPVSQPAPQIQPSLGHLGPRPAQAASPGTLAGYLPSHPSELGAGRSPGSAFRPDELPRGPSDLQSPSWPSQVRQQVSSQPAPLHARPESRPEGTAQPGPRPRPIDGSEPDRAGKRRWGRPIALAGMLVLLAIGGKLAWDHRDQLPGLGQARVLSVTEQSPAALRAPPFKADGATLEAVDEAFQQSVLWQVIKAEFPEWYADRVKEALSLRSENRDEQAIAKHLVEAVVGLRRKHADQALAASPGRLRFVAISFIENLKSLSKHSTEACYGYISQGETSSQILPLLQSSDLVTSLHKQVTAVFEAAAEGRRAPQTHPAPRKSDYDTLSEELKRIGWSQSDLQLFSDPRALSRASPAQVCKMVQDWFTAQIAIKDSGIQVRLLVESLRPVVAG